LTTIICSIHKTILSAKVELERPALRRLVNAQLLLRSNLLRPLCHPLHLLPHQLHLHLRHHLHLRLLHHHLILLQCFDHRSGRALRPHQRGLTTLPMLSLLLPRRRLVRKRTLHCRGGMRVHRPQSTQSVAVWCTWTIICTIKIQMLRANSHQSAEVL